MLLYPEIPPLPNVKPAIFSLCKCSKPSNCLLTKPGRDLSDVSASMYIEVGILYPVQGIPLSIGCAGLLRPSVAVLLTQHCYSTAMTPAILSFPWYYLFLFLDAGDSLQNIVSHSVWKAPYFGHGSDKLMKLDTEDKQQNLLQCWLRCQLLIEDF